MKRYNKKILLLIFVLGVAFIGFSVLALGIRHNSQIKKRLQIVATKSEPGKGLKYDPVLLIEVSKLVKSMESKGEEYTVEGTLTAINGADSSQAVKGQYFMFTRKKDDCYYRVGDQEMINAQDMNVTVSNEQKTVAISAYKTINQPPLLNSAQQLSAILSSEEYTLTSTRSAGNKTITMVDDHHASCKEYAITYDTTTLQVNRIYGRFTDPTDMQNKAKDKIVDVRITKLVPVSDARLLNAGLSIVTQFGATTQLTENYKTKNYHLIRLQ